MGFPSCECFRSKHSDLYTSMADQTEPEDKKEVVEDDKDEEKAEETAETAESELPPEVDAFLKGKNKYKHPYGPWRPVTKVEPLKR